MSVSEELFEQARQHIPGGVNSPVRAFKSVGGTPIFIKRALGAYIYDEDNQQYVDYVGSWGPMVLGHAHPAVIAAVHEKIENGLSYGAPTEIETTVANKICEIIPSIEKVRMVSSGTEATMSAIRLARGYTGRDKIIKFEGCYHGHADSLLVKAGSGALTLGVPDSPGVPAALAEHTLTATFNDLNSVEVLFQQHGSHIACIIVEPVAGNMNCIPPAEGFLQGLRDLCSQYGAILIFDEVMTGFRVSLNGAQGHYGITPDLSTLGKVIGGGMPVGAFGGKAEIMNSIAPLGPVYQAGTLSGNPVAMAAGLATLNEISTAGFYDSLNEKTKRLMLGLEERAEATGIPFTTNQVCSMFGCFFTDKPNVGSFADVSDCNIERFKNYFHGMLTEGIYLAPSAYETGFMSFAHDDQEIQKTLDAAEKVFSNLT